MGKAIMLQGTGSHAGKSLLCTALCRIFRQDGVRVAPFKAQNMSNNSFVTPDGREIGRAQGVQALAAGAVPEAAMNPILLKPKGGMTSQVVVMGRPQGDLDWRAYRGGYREAALAAIAGALESLRGRYDLIVMEGAGSPAEVNLMARDVANMVAADLADAPVLLVGDIDRGGVFASLLGTMEILPAAWRSRVRGYIINKFRGEAALLRPALDWLTDRTGVRVLGVVPYLPDPGVDEEDSVAVPPAQAAAGGGGLDVAVLRLPHISNFTDAAPLQREPGVAVRYVDTPARLGAPDALLIPGTKNTMADLAHLHATGLAAAVVSLAAGGTPVAGICGGYQMLGTRLDDPDRVEGDAGQVPGLGLLPVTTVFRAIKRTEQVRAAWAVPPDRAPWGAGLAGRLLAGYEIHMGETERAAGATPLLRLAPDNAPEGAAGPGGVIWGTYLHGIFDNGPFRRAWLNLLLHRRGRPPLALEGSDAADDREAALDRLAAHVRQHLDLAAVYELAGIRLPEGRP